MLHYIRLWQRPKVMFEKRIYTILTDMDLDQKVKAKKVFVNIAQDYFDEIGRGI